MVVIAQCGMWLGSLVLVIGVGMARGPVSAGFVIACYGVTMVVAGAGAWFRNRVRRTGHRG